MITGVSLLAGCSSDSSILGAGFTTQAITPAAAAPVTAAAPKVDPLCSALAARIDTLRKEGVVERAEKASIGKTPSVQVKRQTLSQLAELDRINSEFQSKCSVGPHPLQAVAPAVPAAAAVATASNAPASSAQNKAVVVPVTTPPAGVVRQK
jgi:hypothetical protein